MKKGRGRGSNRAERPSNSANFSTGFVTRHQFVLTRGVDPKYRGKTNPLTANDQVLAAGSLLFSENCNRCHNTGAEKSTFVEYMDPQPPDLSLAVRLPVDSGTYLFWTISTGGSRFNTPMPRFASSLGMPPPDRLMTDQEIWQLVSYIQQRQSSSGKIVDPQSPALEERRPRRRPMNDGQGFQGNREQGFPGDGEQEFSERPDREW